LDRKHIYGILLLLNVKYERFLKSRKILIEAVNFLLRVDYVDDFLFPDPTSFPGITLSFPFPIRQILSSHLTILNKRRKRTFNFCFHENKNLNIYV